MNFHNHALKTPEIYKKNTQKKSQQATTPYHRVPEYSFINFFTGK